MMKMRYVAGINTVIVGVLILFSIGKIQNKVYDGIDMVEINQSYKQIEQELERGKEIEELEKKYHCRILLKTDINYESILMKNISEGKIILDLDKSDFPPGKIIFEGKGDIYDRLQNQLLQNVLLCYVLLLLTGYGILIVVYLRYIKPFHKLQYFAAEIAKGNFDVPLEMEKGNYFGAFTESFDIMREELKRARENEYLANVSKKELVAELSHDMKTPIATIKATCEVMLLKEKEPDTLEKVQVIAGKAEMIDNLIGNMFHATLEELEVLRVEPAEILSISIMDMFRELKYYGSLKIVNDIPSCLLYADSLRLNQVVDNIVNNTYKYGGGEAWISFDEGEDTVKITIRDRGVGVPPEELPLITEKFYRGSNAAGKSGSGLGLYLAKSFMESMGGGLEYYNEGGFVVNLYLKKV